MELESPWNLTRAARALTGTPDELAARPSELIEAPSRLLPGATSAERLRVLERHAPERRALQHRLAMDFGERRGWRLSETDFSPRTLARGGVHDGARRWLAFGDWPRAFLDHGYWYRRDRRAVAAVGHPYGLTLGREAEARQWAAELGLAVDLPTDWPSWWFPRRTRIVVFTAAPRDAKAAELPALALNASAVVQELHRASDRRLVAGEHLGAAYTGPDGRAVTLGPGQPVPLAEVASRPPRRPELQVITSADRQTNVERMIAADDIGEDIERQAIQEIDGGESPW